MDTSLLKQVEDLRMAPMASVRQKYRELFGEEPRSRHRDSLFRRVAWRLQAQAEGGLSERARERAFEIANDHDMRALPPRRPRGSQADPVLMCSAPRLDRRIPPFGTVLRREYGGQTLAVKVLPNGFEHQSRLYRSLSSIASEITGTRWNGLAFFGLTRDRKA